MNKNNLLIKLRTKKLGLLIYDARLAAERSIRESADAINVSRYQFKAFENGEQSPSLPLLKELAAYLNLPLDHFWDHVALSPTASENSNDSAFNAQLNDRDKEIGQFLKEKREEQDLSFEELAERTSQEVDQLIRFEVGEDPIPVPVLEILIKELGVPLKQFLEQCNGAESRETQKNQIDQFLELPADLQEFICKPVNRPYLELAARLSELSSEKLRTVAESLLEITY